MLENLRSTSKEYVRSGYCLAIGNLPPHLYAADSANLIRIVHCLAEASKCTSGHMTSTSTSSPSTATDMLGGSSTSGWVKARQDAVKSMQKLVENLFSTDHTSSSYTSARKHHHKPAQFVFLLEDKSLLVDTILDCYLHALHDYSIDSKGDSGSRVREAGMEAAESALKLCGRFGIALDGSLVAKLFANFMQQAVERIDRTRSLAGRVFASLLYDEGLRLSERFPFAAQLQLIFSRELCAQLDWNLAHLTLPLFVRMLREPEFNAQLLSGFVFSIGSLTESLVKPAEQCFLRELKLIEKENPALYSHLMGLLLEFSRSNLAQTTSSGLSTSTTAGNEFRLATSLIKTVDLIVQNSMQIERLDEFLAVFLANVKLTKDMAKLSLYIDLFCDVLLAEFNGEQK